jgi:pyruvate kinase
VKDHADLDFCLERGVDYIALSFVRKASDIENLKRIIHERGFHVPVVAKIEKPDALRNFVKILAASDAIMVARGDLGVELRPERVPLIQKKIIHLCNKAGKPVITATQMLESMITHHTPTRAETSDVANAILDGTDAVMLSGETAVGKYPVEAVTTMVKVALDVEQSELWRIPVEKVVHSKNVTEAVAEAACLAASTLKVKAIVVITQSGSTAAIISRLRPQLPIFAITPFVEIQRRLALYWGVTTGSVPSIGGTDLQIAAVENELLMRGFKKGDMVVITMGAPLASRCTTNLLKVHRLGAESLSGDQG